MFSRSFYIHAPVLLQNVMVSLRGFFRKAFRENSKSKAMFKRLMDNEFSEKSLLSYKEQQLSLSLRNAVETTDYYSYGQGKDSLNLEDFTFISKEVINEAPERFESKNKPVVTVHGSTSGTTGSPLIILQSLDSVIKEQAFVFKMLDWAGYREGDKRAWIRGDLIVPVEQNHPPFWRYSWLEHIIMLSSFHMSREALPLYIKAMVDFEVDIIQAYPSSIATLARYLRLVDEYYPGKIKSVITSSEMLLPEDREIIEERFRCKVFDWYGQFERVAVIANCEYGHYHVLTDYSYVEFLNAGDGTSEIVGTNFHNRFYPLIRYKTGDHVILSKKKQCSCGRVYPLVERIDGRLVDFLYAFNGSKVFALDQCVKGISGVLGSQFVQDKLDEVKVRVVADERFDAIQEQKLREHVRSRLGLEMNIVIERVEKLIRTKNGKVRQAVCNVGESR